MAGANFVDDLVYLAKVREARLGKVWVSKVTIRIFLP